MHYDLVGIFAAGLLTFASPCILPLAPVYLGLLSGASFGELKSGRRTARAMLSAAAFALGLGLVFVLLGMAATTVGHALVRHRSLLLQLGGLTVFLFGLKYLGVLVVPWMEKDVRPGLERARGGSVAGAFAMGAAFALGWTPCIGPVLGSVLTFAATSTTSPWQGAAYLAAYAAGLALPLVGAAAVAPLALGALQKAQRWMRPMQLATGGLLAAVGLLLITDNLDLLAPSTSPAPLPSAKVEVAAAAPAPAPFEQGGGTCATGQADGGTCGLTAGAASPGAGAPQIPPGPVMIEFVARACPVCQRMAPVVQAVERDCAGHAVRVHRVEVDAPGGRDLARGYGVMGVPTFLFLDARNQEVARLVGQQPLETLVQSLQVVSGAQCKGYRALPAPPT